jgi:hypothetical protein
MTSAESEDNNIITSPRKLFIVKRRNRSGEYNEPICLYDKNNNYRGVAAFSKKSEAEQYLKTYQEKLRKHFQSNTMTKTRANLKRV